MGLAAVRPRGLPTNRLWSASESPPLGLPTNRLWWSAYESPLVVCLRIASGGLPTNRRRLVCLSPKAMANASPGLFQPWDKGSIFLKP